MSQDLREFVREGRNYAILEGEAADLALERHMAEAAMIRQLRALEFTPGAVGHFLNDAIRHLTYNGHGIYDFAGAVEILQDAQKAVKL